MNQYFLFLDKVFSLDVRRKHQTCSEYLSSHPSKKQILALKMLEKHFLLVYVKVDNEGFIFITDTRPDYAM